ncbi:MAG: DUF378 domain-containing protein [Sedimentisphaerales bacterium]|nr:DUF378 domain-containing protein [Sedimentisphaerales bacterium]
MWKYVDVAAYSLLLIGAINWGLVGFFGFDLVAAIFGSMSVVSRIVYALVGLAALYDLISMPAILKRWEVHLHQHPAHAHA